MSGARVLVVNADDYGLTPGVCDAVLRAHQRGVVTSTSALVVAPAFEANVAAARDSGIGIGIHLCAVGEDPPLLTAAEIPSLVDRRGHFAPSWRSFITRAARGGIDSDDLRRELGAQLDLLRATVGTVTHVDAHQNLHLWPGFAPIALDLAADHDIGVVRVPVTRAWGPASAGVRVLGARLRRAAEVRSLAVPDEAAGLDEAGRWSLASLVAAVDRLGGTTARHADLAVHPGTDPDPDRSRYGWGYRWAQELEALCAPDLRQAIGASGFELSTFEAMAPVT